MKKISKRLQKINNMITADYSCIWDCCCDHGLLGLTLLKRKAATNIHFVDIVPSLITHLDLLLQKHFSSIDFAQRWQTHCIDVTTLPLTVQDKQLVIITGVGGELLIKFIDEIVVKFQQQISTGSRAELEFMLCPVHYNYQVRQCLIRHHFTLVDECIVTENKRFYEIIHVSLPYAANSASGVNVSNITATGNKMWDLSLEEHQHYLEKTIEHYQRMLFATKTDEQVAIKTIIKQYAALSP